MKTKIIFTIMLYFFAKSAWAVQLSIQDPCSRELWLSSEVENALGKNVGSLTIAELEKHKIPYLGSERGIRSIRQSLTGDDALEIISNEEMRAYGWCFRVNDQVSKLYADEHRISSANDKIEWFYGYAHYVRGVWLNFCEPSFLIRSVFICK